ncbi:MAG: phosphodiester glycosidase family protein [Lachnospiraceae bacterium]|nr:phosphodiester glycosidase family protein [Lachnospiraceae bacterium]
MQGNYDGYYDRDGNYIEDGYYDENGDYIPGGWTDPEGNYHPEGWYDDDGNYVENSYYDENGNFFEYGYFDPDGNYIEYEYDEPEEEEDDDFEFLEEGDEYLEDDDDYYLRRGRNRYEEEYSRSGRFAAEAREEKRRSVTKSENPNRRSVGHRIWSVVWRVLVVLLVTIGLLVFFLVGALKLIFNGPSEAISTQYVSTFHETSALKWLPGLFMDKEKVEAILAKNMMPEAEEGTASNQEMIVIDETPKEDVEPIVLEELFGTTYHGYMLTIQDPSRVYVGTVPQFFEGGGQVVSQFCERYGAVGGVNGGEFVDMGSYSYTAMPVGGVVTRGEAVWENNAGGKWNLVCMTNENKLILLKGYSVQAAVNDYGVRDCVHVKHETGPFLIIDGEPLEVPDTDVYGGGKNPRTAIGQRADGAILMCVVDGRQASSLGATFKDMIDIMKEYGAVNAACLDGGTSTQMYYEGKVVNNPYSPTGPRRCPTAFLIDPVGNTEGGAADE